MFAAIRSEFALMFIVLALIIMSILAILLAFELARVSNELTSPYNSMISF